MTLLSPSELEREVFFFPTSVVYFESTVPHESDTVYVGYVFPPAKKFVLNLLKLLAALIKCKVKISFGSG